MSSLLSLCGKLIWDDSFRKFIKFSFPRTRLIVASHWWCHGILVCSVLLVVLYCSSTCTSFRINIRCANSDVVRVKRLSCKIVLKATPLCNWYIPTCHKSHSMNPYVVSKGRTCISVYGFLDFSRVPLYLLYLLVYSFRSECYCVYIVIKRSVLNRAYHKLWTSPCIFWGM